MSAGSALVALIFVILKLTVAPAFLGTGTAWVLLALFFLGGLQLFFCGLVGEYAVSTNTRMMKRPLVVEKERVNFK